jgi:hypothetical protein
MKKSGKILLGFLGLGVAAIFGYKAYKKGMEELENQELGETEDLEKAGVDTSKVRSEVKEDDEDFTKMLYTAIRFNSDIDMDLIELESNPERAFKGAVDCIDSEVIHVRQRIDTRRKNPRRVLDFLIEIQDWFVDRKHKQPTYRDLTIGNYFSTFSETSKKLWETVVRISDKPEQHPVIYVVISREIDGERIVEYREIKQKIYGVCADEFHDGLAEFYKAEKTKFGKIGSDIYTKDEADWVFENCPDLDRNDETFLVEDLAIMYLISFPIRSHRQGELYGVDLKTAIECIKYLTNEMAVTRENSSCEYRYKHILFNAPDPDGKESLVWYYTVDENENVITNDDHIFYDRITTDDE